MLRGIQESMTHLQLRGLAPATAHKLRLPLELVYVQHTTVGSDETSGVTVSPSTGLLTREEQRTTQLSFLLAQHPRLLVLAPAGAGKTTFLRYLSLIFAAAMLEGRPEHIQERLGITWPKPMVPLYIPLREIGHAYAGKQSSTVSPPNADLILRQIAEVTVGRSDDTAISYIESALRAGRCLVMFDGLDEVADVGIRDLLDDNIESLASRYPTNRYLVTSRPEGMIKHGSISGAFTECQIGLLRPEDIRTFVYNWYSAIHRSEPSQEATAVAEADELLREIDSDENVRDLARSPLVLTVIAAMHYSRLALPSRRVELYDQCTLALCGEWDLAKPGLAAKSIRWYSDEDQMTAATRRLQLEYIADHLMSFDIEDDSWLNLANALVTASPRFQSLGHDAGQQAAYSLLQATALRGGILEEHGSGRYRFTYPAFRQYLCARRMVRTRRLRREFLARVGDPRWTEVLRLVIGQLSQNDPERTQRLLRDIMEGTALTPVEAALLAGECLQDCDRSGLSTSLQEQICASLLQVFQNDTSEFSRYRAGTLLGTIHDPRDFTEFVKLETGSPTIGSPQRSNERPEHSVTVHAFQIARYPVTNSEYERFIAAGGYRDPNLWTRSGWRWRVENEIMRPFYWDVPRMRAPNQPVVGVSWFEAVAYAHWANARLPTEVEWEHTARYLTSSTWPWGDAFVPGICNVAGSAPGGPTPVGMYPASRSKSGADDMYGNVWEWCASAYLPYPVDAAVSDEPEGEDPRVLRGGSWYSAAEEARPSARRWLHPGARQFNFGLRLARSEE